MIRDRCAKLINNGVGLPLVACLFADDTVLLAEYGQDVKNSG